MKIYFASGNAHKKEEMSRIFPEHTIVIPRDEGIEFDPEETGSTFMENSMIKAAALWSLVRQPVLADDSGICVDALGGRPGVYSARYTGSADIRAEGKKLTDGERNALLLAEGDKALSLLPPEQRDRSCRFVCALVLYLNPWRMFTAQETLEGTLAETSCGAGGFGYDPLVYLPARGKTVAELAPEVKNTISHRARAAAAIKAVLKTLESSAG